MLNKVRNQSGFTLIELLIVVIIVAVLAAVGIPLLQGNVERAKLTEADAGLGTIKTGMRAYLAEHGSYATPTDLSVIGIKLPGAGDPLADPPVAATPGDLDGRYFDTGAYSIQAATDTTFCAAVAGALGTTAPERSDVALLVRSMDHNGYIYNSTDCTGTAINS